VFRTKNKKQKIIDVLQKEMYMGTLENLNHEIDIWITTITTKKKQKKVITYANFQQIAEMIFVS